MTKKELEELVISLTKQLDEQNVQPKESDAQKIIEPITKTYPEPEKQDQTQADVVHRQENHSGVPTLAVVAIMLLVAFVVSISCNFYGVAHQKGYKIGHEVGYRNGKEAGFREGKEVGYREGYREGQEQATKVVPPPDPTPVPPTPAKSGIEETARVEVGKVRAGTVTPTTFDTEKKNLSQALESASRNIRNGKLRSSPEAFQHVRTALAGQLSNDWEPFIITVGKKVHEELGGTTTTEKLADAFDQIVKGLQ